MSATSSPLPEPAVPAPDGHRARSGIGASAQQSSPSRADEVERTCHLAQASGGQMQVAGGRFQARVAQQPSATVRTSAPASSRCVAKLCLRVCGDTVLVIPALRAALIRIRLMAPRLRCVSGLLASVAAGKQVGPTGPERPPVSAQRLEHPRAHHHIARSRLSGADVDEHAARCRDPWSRAPPTH